MTPLQTRNLRLYLQFRDRPMTVGALIWANRRMYLLLLLLVALLAIGFYAFVDTLSALSIALLAAGALLRDIGHFRRSAAVWPVLRAVTDWAKVEALVSAEQ